MPTDQADDQPYPATPLRDALRAQLAGPQQSADSRYRSRRVSAWLRAHPDHRQQWARTNLPQRGREDERRHG